MNEHQEEFTQARLIEVVKDARTQPASAIVQRISAVAEHRSGYRSFVSWPVCPYPALDWSPPRRTKLRQIELIESYFTRWRELALESKRRLVEIAELTGGSEIRPAVLTQSTSGPVQKALEDVRAGYILRYTPTGVPETGWHPITVTIKRPGTYQVQVRPGYQR